MEYDVLFSQGNLLIYVYQFSLNEIVCASDCTSKDIPIGKISCDSLLLPFVVVVSYLNDLFWFNFKDIREPDNPPENNASLDKNNNVVRGQLTTNGLLLHKNSGLR